MSDTKVGFFTINPATNADSLWDQPYKFTAPEQASIDLTDVATVVVTKSGADLTVKIPIKILDGQGTAVSLPFSGPATISSVVASASLNAVQTVLAETGTGTCLIESNTVENLVQMEDHILFKVKQTYTEAEDCDTSATTVKADSVKAYWAALAAELAKDTSLLFSIVKLGCHQQANNTEMKCVGGYKIPAGVTEAAEASLKVFKASDTITTVNVATSAAFPMRKSGSMGAAVVGAATATCSVTFESAAYKVSYTNKGDDEVICIFEATYNTPQPTEAYVYKASDGIAFTTEHVSVKEDDKTKLALSAGYLNSSWSLLTIILIIGGVLVVAIVLIFWWFRPSDREPEEDD